MVSVAHTAAAFDTDFLFFFNTFLSHSVRFRRNNLTLKQVSSSPHFFIFF